MSFVQALVQARTDTTSPQSGRDHVRELAHLQRIATRIGAEIARRLVARGEDVH